MNCGRSHVELIAVILFDVAFAVVLAENMTRKTNAGCIKPCQRVKSFSGGILKAGCLNKASDRIRPGRKRHMNDCRSPLQSQAAVPASIDRQVFKSHFWLSAPGKYGTCPGVPAVRTLPRKSGGAHRAVHRRGRKSLVLDDRPETRKLSPVFTVRTGVVEIVGQLLASADYGRSRRAGTDWLIAMPSALSRPRSACVNRAVMMRTSSTRSGLTKLTEYAP